MRAATLWTLAASGQARLLAAVNRVSRPFFLVSFLGAAHREGLLARLHERPHTTADIGRALGLPQSPDDDAREALEAWLQVGASVGVLELRQGRWALRGYLADAMARPQNAATAALLLEFATLHHALIVDGPARLRAGRWFAPEETDAELIALTSRTVEPFIQDILREVVPATGPIQLLEMGCGSGTHIRFAAELNPDLTALGLDVSAEVAAGARANLAEWGLSARATVEVGDLLQRAPCPTFDLVTLHQNIYYFPVRERATVLRRMAAWLAPGGRLLVTTACRAPGAGFAVLNLWGALTAGAGRLPDPDELMAACVEAGLERVERINPVAPSKGFVGVVGHRPVTSPSAP